MEKVKTALVTGASTGIGLEIARELAKMGTNLVIVSRSENKLMEIKALFEKEYGISIAVLPCDLSKAQSADSLFKTIKQKGIVIDYLVNNAGVGLFGESITQTEEEVNAMLTLNILSLTTLCRLFGEDMKNRKGQILNIASMAANFPIPFYASYSASKAYVLHYSLSLRAELKKYGVAVTVVMPGFVKTNFDKTAKISDNEFAKFSERIGGNAEMVARVAVKAMLKRKAKVIPGVGNKITTFFSTKLPKTAVAGIMYGFIDGMVNKK